MTIKYTKKMNEKIDKAFEGLKVPMKCGETVTIRLSGLFDDIDWEADFEDEEEEQ